MAKIIDPQVASHILRPLQQIKSYQPLSYLRINSSMGYLFFLNLLYVIQCWMAGGWAGAAVCGGGGSGGGSGGSGGGSGMRV